MIAHAPGIAWPGLLVVALFGAVTLLAGCKRLPPPPAPAAEMTMGVTVSEASKGMDSLPAVDVYVDDSESMKGFVGAKNSEYRRVVGALFEQLITTGYRYSATRFRDVQSSSPSRVALSEMLAEQFYSAPQAPLATLLAKIDERDSGQNARNDRKGSGRLIVAISDLVQSEQALVQQDFIGAFRQGGATRRHVLLVGFRSAFVGTYFIETIPKRVSAYKLTLDGESLACSRPFYLVVFASSRQGLDDFQRYVIDRLGATEESLPPTAKVESPTVQGALRECVGPKADSPNGRRTFPGAVVHFRPSDPPLGITDMSLVAHGSFGTYSARESLDLSAVTGAAGYLWTLVERRAPDRDVTDLRLRVTATSTLPIRSLAGLEYEVARRGAEATRWLPTPVSVGIESSAPAPLMSGNGVSRSFVLLYQFPRTQRYAWDFYRVRMRAGRANVLSPAWVALWSTRSDGDPAQGNRTLNLHLVVTAMIRHITEEVVLSELYLRLGRE